LRPPPEPPPWFSMKKPQAPGAEPETRALRQQSFLGARNAKSSGKSASGRRVAMGPESRKRPGAAGAFPRNIPCPPEGVGRLFGSPRIKFPFVSQTNEQGGLNANQVREAQFQAPPSLKTKPLAQGCPVRRNEKMQKNRQTEFGPWEAPEILGGPRGPRGPPTARWGPWGAFPPFGPQRPVLCGSVE